MTVEKFKQTKKQKKDLQTLVDHLEWVRKNDPDSFSLTYWMGSQGDDMVGDRHDKTEWAARKEEGRKLNCGTTACLVGMLPVVFPKRFKWGEIGGSDWLQDFSEIDGVVDTENNSVEEKSLVDIFGGNFSFWEKTIRESEWDYKRKVTAYDVIRRLRKYFDI